MGRKRVNQRREQEFNRDCDAGGHVLHLSTEEREGLRHLFRGGKEYRGRRKPKKKKERAPLHASVKGGRPPNQRQDIKGKKKKLGGERG